MKTFSEEGYLDDSTLCLYDLLRGWYFSCSYGYSNCSVLSSSFSTCSTISLGCSSCWATSLIVLYVVMRWLVVKGMMTRLEIVPFFFLSAIPTSLSWKIIFLLLMTFFFRGSHSLYSNSSSPNLMNMQRTNIWSSLIL